MANDNNDDDIDDLEGELLPTDEELDMADELSGLDEGDEDEDSEEDDDNPYQESDEALPDDDEEAAISRDLSREGKFFGEV